jgi:alpha/beta superfamily hydrolase
LLPKNICLFSFDFCGCGKSEGDYISLGYYEKDDVNCVIEYLMKSKKVSKIGLWGRSMGAVTAIMYASSYPNKISALVLDSGFYSLKKLIYELVKSKINLPDFIIEKVLAMVKETIQEKAKFNLDEIEPQKFIQNCDIPAFFIHGKEDNFVLPHHCHDLFNAYKGKKHKHMVKGNHNTARTREIKNKASIFLSEHLKDSETIKDDTIINLNTYQRIIFNNNNIVLNFNDKKMKDDDLKDSKDKDKKFRVKDNSVDVINRNNNCYNFFLGENIDENDIILNKNASQNMRAYSNNKYSKNDLNIINNKTGINAVKSLNINLIRVNKNNSDSSSDTLEEPSVYTKKSLNLVQSMQSTNANKVRSISLKHMNKNNNNNNNYKKAVPFAMKKKNIKTVDKGSNAVNKPKLINNKISNQAFNFFNNIIKDNNIKSNKNISKTGKTFSNNFYKRNNNNLYNINSINVNTYDGTKKNEHIFFYSSKRPIDKENNFFRKNVKKDNVKNPNNNENNNNKIANLANNNNKEKKKEERKNFDFTENTSLDENEEQKGKNLPF